MSTQMDDSDSRAASRGVNFAESPTGDGPEEDRPHGVQRRRSTRLVNALFNYEQEFIQTRRASMLGPLEQPATDGGSPGAVSSSNSSIPKALATSKSAASRALRFRTSKPLSASLTSFVQ